MNGLGDSVKTRVKAIYRSLKQPVDAIVLSNSTDPHIDLSFFYATGMTDGLFEGCTAWLFPDGRCEIVTSALGTPITSRFRASGAPTNCANVPGPSCTGRDWSSAEVSV